MPNRSISAAENGAVSPKSTRLTETARPMRPMGQPNSSCSGVMSTPGVDRNPAAPMAVRKATAATHQAGWIRPSPLAGEGARVRGVLEGLDLRHGGQPARSGRRPDEWPESQDVQRSGHERIRPHRVVVLALPSVVAFELGLPHRFFAASAIDPDWPGPSRSRGTGHPAYEVVTVTVDDGPVTTSAGYQVTPTHPHTALAAADTIVVPGITDRYAAGDGILPPDLAALLDHRPPGVRWVSICTGAFVLAAAGLLDGLDATTHWAHAAHFRRLFPQVRLDEDVLYVDNGDILTSAGNAAGIDLLLHLLRRDLGSDVANRVARGAVVAPWRAGGQAQFIERPVPDVGDDGTGPARAWALAHLDEPVDAGRAGRPGRDERAHLHPPVPRGDRRDRGRVAAAGPGRPRPPPAGDDRPAASTRSRRGPGFGTSASLRQHLTAAVGYAPLAYRRTYRAEGA